MVISAVVMGAAEIFLIFLPEEISQFLNLAQPAAILLQIIGALYFAFAILNWTAKANLIGGTYSKPIAIGNFTHFLIGALTFVKLVLLDNNVIFLWVCTIVYLIFALLFGWVFFTSPTIS